MKCTRLEAAIVFSGARWSTSLSRRSDRSLLLLAVSLAALSVADHAVAATTFYGTPTANCGFIATECAYVNPALATATNNAGDIYAPANDSFSNFTNLGIFNNFGYVFSGGLFDNRGYTNAAGATFNNLGSASSLAMIHGSNAGTINNQGLLGLNWVRDPASGIFHGTNYPAELFRNSGTISNEGSIINRGSATNTSTGTITNNAGATFVSSYVATSPFAPGVVAIQVQNSGILTNRGSLTNGSQADATLGIHSSTIVNHNTFVNDGSPTPSPANGYLENWDSIENVAAFENKGGGLLNNYFTFDNLESSSTTGTTFVNSEGTVNNYGAFRNGANVFSAGESSLVNDDLINNYGSMENNKTVTNNGRFNVAAGTLTNHGLIDNTPNGTLTVDGNVVSDGEIFNSGQVQVNFGGSVNGAGVYIQNAGKTRIDGDFSQTEVVVNGGSFGGSGTYTGNFRLNAGAIAPGDPTTLTIDGNLYFSDGLLDIKIAGLNDMDRLVVTGTAQFTGGAILLDFINGFAPNEGDVFDFLIGDASLNGLIGFSTGGLQEGFEFDIRSAANGLRMTALNNGVSSVPLPAAAWLLISGLGSLAMIGRRRATAGTTLGGASR